MTAKLFFDRQKGLFCLRQNRLALYRVKDDIPEPFSASQSEGSLAALWAMSERVWKVMGPGKQILQLVDNKRKW